MRRLKLTRSSEYKNLRHVVPSLRRQRDVGKVEVVTEAARYIDHLHKTLIERFVLCGIPDSLKDILGTDDANELGSRHIMNLVTKMAESQRQQEHQQQQARLRRHKRRQRLVAPYSAHEMLKVNATRRTNLKKDCAHLTRRISHQRPNKTCSSFMTMPPPNLSFVWPSLHADAMAPPPRPPPPPPETTPLRTLATGSLPTASQLDITTTKWITNSVNNIDNSVNTQKSCTYSSILPPVVADSNNNTTTNNNNNNCFRRSMPAKVRQTDTIEDGTLMINDNILEENKSEHD